MRLTTSCPGLHWPCGRGLAAGPALAQEVTEARRRGREAVAEVVSNINSGDTAWMLTSSLLVLFMILPGLALFYGGLVRAKNMLSVLMQCTIITSVVMVIYVLYGYSLVLRRLGEPLLGRSRQELPEGVDPGLGDRHDPGARLHRLPDDLRLHHPGADRRRLRRADEVLGGDPLRILWVTVVYFPIAHMAWDANGLYFQWGAFDFAGGTVVHINAGIAALVGAMVIGPRIGYRKEIMPPHSMTLTMVGASILWVGWFGFNAGSALSAGSGAALAMMNTFVATAGAVLCWSALEAIFRGKASMLGAASGMVAGLVAVTPAAGFIGPVGAIVLGVVAAAPATSSCRW